MSSQVRWNGTVFYPVVIEADASPNPESRLIQLSSTVSIFFGLKPDGTVETWGHAGNSKRVSESMKDHPPIVRLARGGNANHMLGLTETGKVIAWHHYPGNSPTFGVLEPPGDLEGEIVDLFVGWNVSAVKIKNRGWRAWGNNKHGVIDQVNKLGPEVFDLEAHAADPDGQNFVVWIEE